MTEGNPNPTPKGYVTSQADGTIVYALWNQSVGSQIRIVNTDGTNDFPIALLPAKIKDVHVLSASVFLYINDTDEFDHGKTIDIYNTTGKTSKTIYTANPGWGIDDVIVSPDKDYISWWEVKFSERSKILLGGQSRVYLKNINTDETTLVVDEISSPTDPIHYPLFFDHNNRLFMDTFIPNQGRGFYLGVTYVSPDDPTTLIPVPELARGKFSSNPVLAPIENKIVFSGFDPQAKTIYKNPVGYDPSRLELDNPNQLVLLDLDSSAIKIIAASKSDELFYTAVFSTDNKKIIYTLDRILTQNGETTSISPTQQVGVYELETGLTTYKDIDSTREKMLIDYSSDKLVYANTINSKIANLGETYQPVIKSFSFGQNTAKDNMQFLSYLPRKSKSGSLMTLEGAVVPTEQDKSSLKLTQLLVPEVKNVDFRKGMQNNPIALDVNRTKNPEPTATPIPTPKPPPNGGCPKCQRARDDACVDCPACGVCQKNCGKCYDSPLYLYPQEKTEVAIKAKVSENILETNPEFESSLWHLTAYPDGTLETAGHVYDKILYDYLSENYPSPTSGIVSSAKDLSANLKQYGFNLGLNTKELSDFVKFWEEELAKRPAPYYFISHYDKDTASKIMSFEIEPKPDTFMQVIMYFKALNRPVNVSPPDFEDIPERKGFTVVDWSGKIEP